MQIPKLACMVVVSVLAGLLCRHFCPVDELGYIMTSKNSWFKVRDMMHSLLCGTQERLVQGPMKDEYISMIR